MEIIMLRHWPRLVLLGISIAFLPPLVPSGQSSRPALAAPFFLNRGESNRSVQSRVPYAPRRISPNAEVIQQLALALANRDRTEVGLTALSIDPTLSRAAQRHAEDMLRRNYFDHYSPEGKAPSDRLRAVGGQGYPAENIIMTHNPSIKAVSPRLLDTFQHDWMNSASHRRNLMNPKYARFGYGFAIEGSSGRVFAVQMFQRL